MERIEETDEGKEGSFVNEIARENMNRKGGNKGKTREEREKDRIKLWFLLHLSVRLS